MYNLNEPQVTVEYFGCTNSTVSFSTNATGIVSWMFGFGANPPTSSSSTQVVEYTGPLGPRSFTLIVDGVPYFFANYILVENSFTKPQITASRTTLCAGESIDLSTTFNALSYSWQIPGGSITTSTEQNPGTVTFDTPGDYVVELTVTSCCGTSRATDTIHVLETVQVDLGGPHRACFLGDLPVLDANGNAGATYAWTLNGQPLGNQKTQETLFTGTYAVTVSYGPGCSGNGSTFVEIYTTTPVNLGPDVGICQGSPLPVLDAGVTNSTYAWTWNTNPIGTGLQTLTAAQPGTYVVNVTENSGCTGTDEVAVVVSNPFVFLGADINVCANASFPVLDAQNQGATYQWSLNNAPIAGATQQTFQPTSGGNIGVTITDQYGCNASDNITINTFPTLNAAINGPSTATLGIPANFSDQTTPAANQWTWNFADGTPLVNVQNPIHVFTSVGIRPVFMIASNGLCSDTAYKDVDVRYDCTSLGLNASFSLNTSTVILSATGTVVCTNNSTNATEYLWDFGDGSPQDPNTNPIHAYNQPGNYLITLYAINYNCTTSTSLPITVIQFGVGLNDMSENGQVLVYPNPTSGLLTIETQLPTNGHVNAELNDVLGKRVVSKELNGSGPLRIDLDLTNQSAGVYLLNLRVNDGLYVSRIVVE